MARTMCLTRVRTTRLGLAAIAVITAASASGHGSTASAVTIHVSEDAPAGGDGRTWASAFRELRDALDVAQRGDAVWIAAGTYRPAPPGASRAATFEVPGGVTIHGGLVAGAMSLEGRDPRAHPTILSGDLNGDDAPSFAGRTDNTLHVVTVALEALPVTIDGVTITGGYADDDGDGLLSGRGGGVRCLFGDVTIRNTVLIDNAATVAGGGVSCLLGRLRLESVEVRDSAGGGLDADEADAVTMIDCIVAGNDALVAGGVRLTDVDDVRLERCVFRGNRATAGAGAGLVMRSGAFAATGCTFERNQTDGAGGALLVDGTAPACFTRCVFTGNAALLLGGAIGAGRDVTFINCLVAGNWTGSEGGAVYTAGAARFVNCTIAGNLGRGIVVTPEKPGTSVTVHNGILWGNGPDPVGAFGGGGYEGAEIVASDVEGEWSGAGGGNLSADPRFVHPGGGDWRLTKGSPCIDAGDDELVPARVRTDLAGAPRFAGAAVDQGAYEGASAPARAAPIGVVPADGAIAAQPTDRGLMDAIIAAAVLRVGDVNGDGAVDGIDLAVALGGGGRRGR